MATKPIAKSKMLNSSICILCAGMVKPKLDKRGEPFIRCPFCGTFFFFHSDLGKIGYEITSKVISANLVNHKEILMKKYTEVFRGKQEEEDELLETIKAVKEAKKKHG